MRCWPPPRVSFCPMCVGLSANVSPSHPGACAIMALERVPADIRKDGGVARMSDPKMIKAIKAAVTIPVMAKSRIGHFVECQVLQEIGADYIDESEVRAHTFACALWVGFGETTLASALACANLDPPASRASRAA